MPDRRGATCTTSLAMKARFSVVLGLLVALVLPACAASPVHVDHLQLHYATAPQPQRVSLPLTMVIDPARVPDTIRTADTQTKQFDIYEVQTFMRRDVSRVLGDYFDEVLVDEAPALGAPGYLAEVSIVRLDTAADQQTAVVGAMIAS